MSQKEKAKISTGWDQEGKKTCVCSSCGESYIIRRRGFWQNSLRCPSCTSVSTNEQKG